jgi:peptide chain release factor 2
MGAPEFWSDADKAKSISSKAAGLKKKLESFLKLEGRVADIEEGVSLAKEFDDADLATEALANAKGLENDIRSYELLTLLPRDFRRSRWHRSLRLGANASPDVHALGRAKGLHRGNLGLAGWR